MVAQADLVQLIGEVVGIATGQPWAQAAVAAVASLLWSKKGYKESYDSLEKLLLEVKEQQKNQVLSDSGLLAKGPTEKG